MQYIVSAKEMKALDQYTMEEIGIPSAVLMERAALAAFEVTKQHLRESHMNLQDASALLLVGFGNNGGDGIALARLYTEAGIKTEVVCVRDAEKATSEWRRQREIATHYPILFSARPSNSEYTILVDALFGVGLTRKLEGKYFSAIERFNHLLHGWKLALDLPSGVSADSGEILGIAANVDETVTFGFLKKGLVLYPGCQAAGKVTVADVGISEAACFCLEPGCFTFDEKPELLLPRRAPDGNKGTFGKVLLIAGSKNMAGAAILSARAAYRAGAGMVKVVTTEVNREILQRSVPEALLRTDFDLADDVENWADVIVIGPGMGKSEQARSALEEVLRFRTKPIIIDADALNLLAENDDLKLLLKNRENELPNVILTPHPGEFSRLFEVPVGELKSDLEAYARKMAQEFHCVVVAKDARTFVARENGASFLNLFGNSGMATAGSGDVLAGFIGGLAAQGMDAFDAACLGVALHGKAGDFAARELGEHAVMAGDLIDYFYR